MKIQSDTTITVSGEGVRQGVHFTITPKMGVVGHFPREICEAMIEKGATRVAKKSSQEVEAEPAELTGIPPTTIDGA